jgi:hypothetical protein
MPAPYRSRTIRDPGDTGAIDTGRSGVCALISAGAETRTVPAPQFLGQEITICFDTDGGDVTATAPATVNQTGNNTLIFADAGDEITLRAISLADGMIWRVASNDGVALSTV